MDNVWMVLDLSLAQAKVEKNIDNGSLDEARLNQVEIQTILDEIDNNLGQRGGRMFIKSPYKSVAMLPVSLAEQLPDLLESHRLKLAKRLGVGIGMDLYEAAASAKKSMSTGKIELYDPEDQMYKSEWFKSENEYELPPNLFDPLSPAPKAKDDTKWESEPEEKAITVDAKTQMEAERQYIEAFKGQIGGDSIKQQMQQMQQQMQQAQQAQAQQAQAQQQDPNLLNAMQGEQVAKKPQTETKQNKEESNDEESAQDTKSDDKEESGDKSHEKLASLLAIVQDKMPEVMKLADKNPDAFKKVMALFQKLVTMAKSEHKKIDYTGYEEEITKAIHHLHLPVGSHKGRKQKVIINGKEVWRSMASGRVKDAQGQPISVKSHNAKAQGEGENG
jgi:hypothetical protein